MWTALSGWRSKDVALLPLVCCLSGCLSFLNPVPESLRHEAQCVPNPCRRCVHVFLIHGLDPLDAANLDEVRDHLRQIGFVNTHIYQYYNCTQIKEAALATNAAHPGEPIAFVGFSLGTLAARRVTHELHDEHCVNVDMLFYIGGWFLKDQEYSRPPYVKRCIHVLGRGCDRAGVPLPDADNIRVDRQHFGSPTEENVLRRLQDELDALAQCPQ